MKNIILLIALIFMSRNINATENSSIIECTVFDKNLEVKTKKTFIFIGNINGLTKIKYNKKINTPEGHLYHRFRYNFKTKKGFYKEDLYDKESIFWGTKFFYILTNCKLPYNE